MEEKQKECMHVANETKQQNRIICLIFAYCNKESSKMIPNEVIQLICEFYEATFYWRIQGDKLTEFMNAANGDIIHNESTIIIKGIEFECTLCPNGWRSQNKGIVAFYCEMKYVTDDVEYFTAFIKLMHENTSNTTKTLKVMNGKGQGFGIYCCKLKECEDVKEIDFNCFVKILHIKYRDNCNKEDFITKIRMKTHVEYEWIISEKKEMQTMKMMHPGIKFGCNKSIDNGNWFIFIQPKGFGGWIRTMNPGALTIEIVCLAVPFGIRAMDIGYDIELRCESKGKLFKEYDVKRVYFMKQNKGQRFLNSMLVDCADVDVDGLLNEKWIGIRIKVDIMNIYDSTERLIDEDQWDKYGFFV